MNRTKKPACKRGHVNPPRNAHGACIQCSKEYRKEHYARDRAKFIARSVERAKRDPDARRDEQRAFRIGVSVSQIRSAIDRANGKCESCGLAVTHKTLCVDHCHSTGRVRGVLCRFCNALEGMLNKQPERVAGLRRYLDREIEQVKIEQVKQAGGK